MPSEITSLAEFIRRIEIRAHQHDKSYIYRGHDAPGLPLKPSLFRNQANRKHENNILRELVSVHPTEFLEDRGVFEQLVRMQHYSLPTRLLDITFNPLVALYFCCRTNPKRDGEFIRIVTKASAIKYYDSDTVSCVANLSNLTGKERDLIRHAVGSDADLRASDVGHRLLQFIKSEKPYFLPRIHVPDLKSVFAVKPRQTNRRLLAQQGAFLLFGLQTELPDENDFGFQVTRIVIPSKSKSKIISALDRINVNASTLFPEMESAARYIMSKVTPASSGES